MDFIPPLKESVRPVHVALPLPLWKEFTYLAPQNLALGTVVQVSFGSRLLWGILWKEGTLGSGALKPILTVHTLLHISDPLRVLMEAMARYVICPLGLVVKMVLPPAIKYGEMQVFQQGNPSPRAPLDGDYVGTLRQWASFLGTSLRAVQTLRRSGALIPSTKNPFSQENTPSLSLREPLILSSDQKKAFADLVVQLKNALPVVLEGVTGSGKTEVLLALCQSVWAQGKQVLVLLPEIMLSYPWCQRVEKYFEVPLTLWHSGMSPRARQEGFENILMGKSPLIIGARSALFLPYARLGLVVVDEEHEAAYKQSDKVFYHGRDMAVLRGHKEGIPVVLASATPSMETSWNVQHKRYGHVTLEHRYGSAQLPVFSCIDMRAHPPKEGAWISPSLRGVLQETLDKGEQSLLFLNRRGYASLWMCYRCGYRAACAHCSAWLTAHEHPPQLLCHYCGYSTPTPVQCPGCGDDQGILFMGLGIERLAKEVRSLFPAARILLLSSDHISSPESMKSVLDSISNRQVDILLGTQLIAKGYHFPYLTCIGIVDTDFALSDMDFRASERLFQLLYQVAGRAGREDRGGRVFLQTMQPDHPLFRQVLSYDWRGFVEQELALRSLQDYPPMTRLTALIVSHKEEWVVQTLAMKWQKTQPKVEGLQVFGPAPAPLNPLRGRYRWRFLLKAKPSVHLYAFLQPWIYADPFPPGVLVEIDRDPYSLL